jgi:pyruvate dehydrogenase E1 component alpha subunit
VPLRVIQDLSVSRLDVLDPDGVVDPELDPDLPRDRLVALYRAMWLAREFDQRMIKLQRQGRLGTFGPATGQEAASVAPAFAMEDDDWYVGTFREPGGRLARGEPLDNALLYYTGFEEGCVQPASGPARRLLPINIIVGSQLLHAVGLAYAMRYRGEKAAVVAFVGDGGTSQGDFHEALNLAAVWRAPVVFVCQNNGWAISIPRDKQTRSKTLAQKALAYGMPGLQVDGNDPLAVFRATRDALARARAGEGPTFLEAVTYRLMMHTTSDDPGRYRSEAEVEPWRRLDPLLRTQRYLERRHGWDERQQAALLESVRAEIEAAVRRHESRPPLPPDAPFDHVFGTRHPVIEEQRAIFREALAREERSRG